MPGNLLLGKDPSNRGDDPGDKGFDFPCREERRTGRRQQDAREGREEQGRADASFQDGIRRSGEECLCDDKNQFVLDP
jgi:hypothetical protein